MLTSVRLKAIVSDDALGPIMVCERASDGSWSVIGRVRQPQSGELCGVGGVAGTVQYRRRQSVELIYTSKRENLVCRERLGEMSEE